MNKLNFFGIGPIIGRIAIPWLAVAIFLSIKFKGTFTYIEDGNRILFYAGLSMLITGLLIYFLTLPLLLKGLKETRLVTKGSYYLCCNPLYMAILLFIFPGISLMMNSWLVLTTSIVAYVLFKSYIKKEYTEMENFFGDDFRKYRAETPEFFPFPVKKWFRSV
jgi:protein-S-isoprenylcysteine O-methyltransferase Ste14